MMRQLGGLEFDVMLEGKAKDLALLRLRSDLSRSLPTCRHVSGPQQPA
jgi:UV DNA damage endonuclease